MKESGGQDVSVGSVMCCNSVSVCEREKIVFLALTCTAHHVTVAGNFAAFCERFYKNISIYIKCYNLLNFSPAKFWLYD